MAAILLAIAGMDPQPWQAQFRALAPRREVRLWSGPAGMPAAGVTIPDRGSIAYACVWLPPPGLLAMLPNLRAVFSLGAGVDHILCDPALPKHVPVVRIVDPDLTMRMTEYVVLHVLMHHRRQRRYDVQQREHRWYEHVQPPAAEVAVGVMGLGVLGQDAVQVLRRLGFQVAGWSRMPKQIDGIETFHGAHGFARFLQRTEILVCLLPATPETQGILCLDIFRRLKRDGALGGAYLINAGRGALQVDGDILAALEEGSLSGATLDVFPAEPLPPTSALWDHPAVTVTPHCAAASDPHALVANILRQIERHEQGVPLEHVVDRGAGY
jgi:glyoxylate/hydroxypyruvate reductase A